MEATSDSTDTNLRDHEASEAESSRRCRFSPESLDDFDRFFSLEPERFSKSVT